MAKIEDVHIMMSPEENLLNRLDFINIKPDYILAEGMEIDLIANKYPGAKLIGIEGVRADLILSIIKFDNNEKEIDLEKICLNWRKKIKPEGILLFVLVSVELDILELGDYLASLNFSNIVVDIEENNIYGHAVGAKEMSIRLDEIKIRGRQNQ